MEVPLCWCEGMRSLTQQADGQQEDAGHTQAREHGEQHATVWKINQLASLQWINSPFGIIAQEPHLLPLHLLLLTFFSSAHGDVCPGDVPPLCCDDLT